MKGEVTKVEVPKYVVRCFVKTVYGVRHSVKL